MSNKILIGVIVAILLLGVGLIMSQSPKEQATVAPTPTSTTQVASPTVGEIKEFMVEGKPFEFSPKEIKVKKDDRVKVTFKNMEGFHDFTIEGLDIKTKQIQAGQEDSVEFVADKAGTFEYFCGVGNHRQMGMVGKFIVEE